MPAAKEECIGGIRARAMNVAKQHLGTQFIPNLLLVRSCELGSGWSRGRGPSSIGLRRTAPSESPVAGSEPSGGFIHLFALAPESGRWRVTACGRSETLVRPAPISRHLSTAS